MVVVLVVPVLVWVVLVLIFRIVETVRSKVNTREKFEAFSKNQTLGCDPPYRYKVPLYHQQLDEK